VIIPDGSSACPPLSPFPSHGHPASRPMSGKAGLGFEEEKVQTTLLQGQHNGKRVPHYLGHALLGRRGTRGNKGRRRGHKERRTGASQKRAQRRERAQARLQRQSMARGEGGRLEAADGACARANQEGAREAR